MTWQPQERSYRETARRQPVRLDLVVLHRSRLARMWETFGRGTNAIIEYLGLASLWDRTGQARLIFVALVAAFFMLVFAALELIEWSGRRWDSL